MRRYSYYVTLCAALLGLSFAAHAESEVRQIAAKDNPHIQKAQEKAVEIVKTFTPQEIANLEIVKDGFGIIRSVRATGRIVEKTVKQCGKDNPEMKETMTTGFNEWQGGVMTVLGDKEKAMKAAIADGRFSKPEDVRAFLDIIDKAALKADENRSEAIKIVSTPSSCEGLLGTMEESGAKLRELLAAVEFPVAEIKPEPEPRKAGAHE
ncbi:MAG: hypothetical protein HYS17_02575 [Micavibrio aeruginosavorus]|uniref:Uncharacterized protein n=1 Tax=Micavibrio aeruginosavorus TaxID=349221 RepID=A0A7T5R364_9BACT|nr:MAG: hypothetical protein HYS17_02575 [Micavibrio aeruginosavorus]